MEKIGDLRVWHIPQVPGKEFFVNVKDLHEAKLVLATLARYDQFQYENNIKPDYCNASGLSILEDLGEEEPVWCDWYNDAGYGIDEVEL